MHLVIIILIEICPGLTWMGATPMTEVTAHFGFSSILIPVGNRVNDRKNNLYAHYRRSSPSVYTYKLFWLVSSPKEDELRIGRLLLLFLNRR